MIIDRDLLMERDTRVCHSPNFVIYLGCKYLIRLPMIWEPLETEPDFQMQFRFRINQNTIYKSKLVPVHKNPNSSSWYWPEILFPVVANTWS